MKGLRDPHFWRLLGALIWFAGIVGGALVAAVFPWHAGVVLAGTMWFASLGASFIAHLLDQSRKDQL